MAYDMNHEFPTEQFRLPSREARDRDLAELDPYARVDEYTTEITAITPPVQGPPWAPEIIMAVVRLASRVALCERNPADLRRLNQFIDARVQGRSNPVGNLRQYQDIQYDVNDATALIRPGGAS